MQCEHSDGLSRVLGILRAEPRGKNKSPPPLQTIVINSSRMHIISAMRAWGWFVARVGDFAGGAWLRPYRPESQEFMRYAYLRCEYSDGLSQGLGILRAEQGGDE